MKRKQVLKGLLVITMALPGMSFAQEASDISHDQESSKDKLMVICATMIDGVSSEQSKYGTVAAGTPVIEAISVSSKEDGVYIANSILENRKHLITYSYDNGLGLVVRSEQLETKEAALHTVIRDTGSCSVVKVHKHWTVRARQASI